MSLARIAAHRGAYAVAVALDTDPRLGAEYTVALDQAWRHRKSPSTAERQWLAVRDHLPFNLADELYGLAIARGLHNAGQALAASIADRYPSIR